MSCEARAERGASKSGSVLKSRAEGVPRTEEVSIKLLRDPTVALRVPPEILTYVQYAPVSGSSRALHSGRSRRLLDTS